MMVVPRGNVLSAFSWPGEVQLDRKWSSVGKGAEGRDPDGSADDHLGDWCDHVAYDPEPRPVAPPSPCCAAVHKARHPGRVVDVIIRPI